MRTIVLVILLTAACAGSVLAYDGGNNALFFDVAPVFLGGISVTYEHELSDQTSIYCALALFALEDPDSDATLAFGEFHVGGRFYYSADMPAIHGGFIYYFGGVGGGTYNEGGGAEDEDVTGAALGLGWGYKGIWDNGFIQEFRAGVNSVSVDFEEIRYGGVTFGMGYSIGFTF